MSSEKKSSSEDENGEMLSLTTASARKSHPAVTPHHFKDASIVAFDKKGNSVSGKRSKQIKTTTPAMDNGWKLNIHAISTILMPLIYRHTCNMVDKTHRNFAVAQPFSIYLTCVFFFVFHFCIVAVIQTPSRTNRRKLRRAQENEGQSTYTQKNNTFSEDITAMCPLCLCNTIVVERANEQKKKQIYKEKIHCSTHTHTHMHIQIRRMKEHEHERKMSNNGKGIYFIPSILAIVCRLSIAAISKHTWAEKIKD